MMGKKLVIAFGAIIALAAGLLVQNHFAPAPPQINARVFEPAREIKPFELIGQLEQPITNQLFDGKWTLIFLGYTHCPDVCPTTLGKLTNSYSKLKAAGMDNLQVLFVSVDPQRDTPARLREYTAYFHPDFIAATGPHSALFPFVRNLGLMYSMTEDTSLQDYAVSHSGGITLINPSGHLHAMFKPKEALGEIPNVDMAQMALDLRNIINAH